MIGLPDGGIRRWNPTTSVLRSARGEVRGKTEAGPAVFGVSFGQRLTPTSRWLARLAAGGWRIAQFVQRDEVMNGPQIADRGNALLLCLR